MKNSLLFIALPILLICSDLTAQNFTTFSQSGNSDYNVNVAWAATNPVYNNCGCHFANRVNISFSNWPVGSGISDNIFDIGAAQSSSSTSTFAIGPSRSYPTNGSMSWIGGNDFFPGDCLIQCAQVAFTGPIQTGTDLPYAPTLDFPQYSADGSINFSWTHNTDIPTSKYRVDVHKNGSPYDILQNLETSWNDLCAAPNDLYEFMVVYTGTTADSTYTIAGNPASYTVPDPILYGQATAPPCGWGKISGKITVGETTTPVPDVIVTAELQSPGSITNGSCRTTYIDTTDAQGDYDLSFIYWGIDPEMATFTVTPFLEMHGFDPAETTTTLDCGSHTKVINIKDTTTYRVLGQVVDVEGCGIDSAFVFATNDQGINTYTEQDGSYSLLITNPGSYNIRAAIDTLILGTTQVVVDQDIQNIDFSYNETDSLSIYVGAGCFEYIGTADVTIRTKGGCFLKAAQTNLDGRINHLELPSREITVEVTNIFPSASSGLDAQDILADFGAPRLINLDSNSTINIIYRKPLSFEFIGVPAPPCPAVEYPVFDQAKSYPITMLVWESPGICLADTGFVAIQNNIGSVGLQSTILDTVPISNGIAVYNLIPGEPVLAAPFLKTLTFTAFVDSQIVSQTIEGIVSGARQRTATFVTGAPVELPYLILRDPPGDASYSFFDENATTTYAQSYSALTGTNIKAWAKLAISVNSLFVKVFGEIGGGVTVAGSKNDVSEYKTTLSHNTSIKTSSEQNVVGEDGDLVYGAAVNFVYGIVDERYFDINTCQIEIDTGIMFSPDTFATKFVKTIKGIRENLIPDLNFLATNPDTTEDARRKFRNEARKWEQVIQMNEDIKTDALKNPIDNYTIESAAGPFGLTTTGSSTKSRVIEFKEVLNGNIAASAGVTLFGAISVSGGIEVTIRSEWGSSTTNSIQESTTTGFVFDDVGDGFNDEVSFDYAVDDVYGTPVFGDPIGRTSCPHEPGTQFIDFPEIVAPNPVKFATGSTDEIEFVLNLRNNSESDNTRTYMLDFIEQSNEFGVQVFSGANPFSGTIPFTIPAGGSVNTTVRVKKSDVSTQFSYEGLQFDLYPACEPLLKSSTFISAYFENDCPYVTMSAPSTDWVANSTNNNLIPITMDGYELNPDVDLIKLVYSEIGDVSWNNTNIEISGFNILPPPAIYNWDVSGIPDGEYLIRWELYCGSSVNVSTRICGLIDRKVPEVFGNEEPRDDIYDPGDKISVMFDEEIDFASLLSNQNYYANNLTKGTSLPLNISLKGTEVIIDLGMSIEGLYNENFEIGLINVGDIYGNYRPDTVAWDFIVSEPDSDRDRVGDLTDRCPGGDDQRDTDMDGLPDDCDCLPTIPLNGRSLTKAAMDFDGEDDYIQLDTAYSNVSNNFSFEFWALPQEMVASNVSQINQGVSPDNGVQPYAIFPIQGENAYGVGHSTAGVAVGKNGIIVHEHSANLLTTPLVHYMPISDWTHIAISFENKQASLYVNGQFVKQGLQSTFMSFVHPSSNIGGFLYAEPGATYFNGGIDEFRFWNYTRSESEIQAQMNQELVGDETGIITYFDFNEGTPFGHNEDLTEIIDKSTNNYSGSINGFTKSGTASNWVTIPTTALDVPYDLCKNCVDTLNAAMDFDGANDQISLASLFADVNTNFSFEFWVNPQDSIFPSAFETNAGLIPLVDDFTPFLMFPIQGGATYGAGHATAGVVVGKNGILVTEHSDNYFVSPLVHYTSISDWTHITIVYENNQPNLYLNGVFIKQGLTSGMSFVHPTSLLGGNNLGQYFNGRLDDFRIWNQARTADQIANNLYTEMLGTESGLEAYYDFNEGNPSSDNTALLSILDLTGNGNDGTLVNLIQSGGYSNWVPSPLNFRIDADEDGRPDACDSCIPPNELVLENQALNGMYMARDKITLGNGITFPPNADVLFRTPLLELFDSVNAPIGVNVLVNPKPCEEE